MPFGWGIVSTGKHPDIKIAPAMAAAAGGELVGVYSRDQHRAEAFAQKHDARAAYSQLGDLLKDSRVDGVFVSSPNALHTMLFCLFKHAAAQAVRDLIVRAGERVLIKRPTVRASQRILAKIGAKATQRVLGRGASRWVPLVGALGVASYAYYDTGAAGRTAMDLFSRDFDGGAGSQPSQLAPQP
jgi:hypothetical protein